MERCYFMFKPGYTDSQTVFEVRERIEEIGGNFVAMKAMQLSKEACAEHYAHIVNLINKENGLPVYPKLEEYMLSDLVIGCIIEGKDGLIGNLRKLMGSTRNPEKGTLREKYTDRVPVEDRTTKNGFHCSDSVENAKEEINRFFVRSKELGVESITINSEQTK